MSKRNDLPTKARGDAAPAGPVSSKAEMAAFLAEWAAARPGQVVEDGIG